MSEQAPTEESEGISRRELSSVAVGEADFKRAAMEIRAEFDEAIELIARLIYDHYRGIPEQVAYWMGQLDGMVRQLSTESRDYGVFLFDEAAGKDPLRPGWMIDLLTRPEGLGISIKRTGHISAFPTNVGRKLIDTMQDRVLAAMQAR